MSSLKLGEKMKTSGILRSPMFAVIAIAVIIASLVIIPAYASSQNYTQYEKAPKIYTETNAIVLVPGQADGYWVPCAAPSTCNAATDSYINARVLLTVSANASGAEVTFNYGNATNPLSSSALATYAIPVGNPTTLTYAGFLTDIVNPTAGTILVQFTWTALYDPDPSQPTSSAG